MRIDDLSYEFYVMKRTSIDIIYDRRKKVTI